MVDDVINLTQHKLQIRVSTNVINNVLVFFSLFSIKETNPKARCNVMLVKWKAFFFYIYQIKEDQ